jgi:hypothetical protein
MSSATSSSGTMPRLAEARVARSDNPTVHRIGTSRRSLVATVAPNPDRYSGTAPCAAMAENGAIAHRDDRQAMKRDKPDREE